MDFRTFLHKKRIDADRFRTQKEAEWMRLCAMYEELGEKAFDQHKKFYFNPLRLMFPYVPPVSEQRVSEKPATAIPKKIPKPVEPLLATPPQILQSETPAEPQPEVRKMPPKMKPVMKPKLVEESEKPEAETPAEPQPEVRKMPPKMKPVMRRDKENPDD